MTFHPPAMSLHAPIVQCLEKELRRRSVEATVHDLLLIAGGLGCGAELARGLVGAALAHWLKHEVSFSPTLSDELFVNDAVIKVVVDPLNHRHYEELNQRVASSKKEVWLLTRSDRRIGWRDAVNGSTEIQRGRVVVRSVESFVGQNITELAGFSAAGKVEQLKELFDLYNTRWIAKVGTPGIRIIMK